MKLFPEKAIILFVLAASLAFLIIAPTIAEDAGTHLRSVGFPGCSFRALLGKPCPLCGGSTALARVASGDLLGAWKANPFAFLLLATLAAAVPLLLIALAWPGSVRPWFRNKLVQAAFITWVMILALTLVLHWIPRLLWN